MMTEDEKVLELIDAVDICIESANADGQIMDHEFDKESCILTIKIQCVEVDGEYYLAPF